MEVENQKAIDNALFKKLEEISIKMPNDPILYNTDVEKYLGMFKVEFEKVQGDTMKKNERFGELLIFLARSVKYFPSTLGWVPGSVMRLMEELGPSLHSYLRKKCAGAIMILRAKNILLPVSTIEFLLRLMRLEDKQLRSMIYKYVLNDIRRMNKHHQNNKINQQIKAFISAYLPKHADKTAQKSLKLLIELYKRNVWSDNRTVNIIADACFAPSSRSRLMACHFLMETTMQLEELPESEDELPDPSEIKRKKGITKNSKHKEKQVEKEKRKAGRRLRKKEIEGRNRNFMPIDLVYNPQVFAEKLFNVMSGKQEKYTSKLVYMSLIARIIWHHKLILLPFYRSLIKYLDPKQKDVSHVLTALAESVHDLVPEDELETIIKHIIEHFVNDRCSEFTMTIGLNTLREIFKKIPSIINEEMMLYLCTYYEYKNKNVSRAAKSVINFVKEYNPRLLEKRYRGNHSNAHAEDQEEEEEGQARPALLDRIPGVQLLQSKGSVPLEMDRVLTDEDFKKIRKLMKKKEEDEEWGKRVDNQIQSSGEEEEEEEEEDEEEGEEGEEGEEEDGEQIEIEDEEGEEQGEEDEEQLQFDSDDVEELEVEDENEEGAQGQEGEEEEEEDEQSDSDAEMEDGALDFLDQVEEQPKKKTAAALPKTKGIKKGTKQDKRNPKDKKKNKDEEEDSVSSDEDESSVQQNPHGFIASNQIAYYKMSKGELKREKKNVKQSKQKFKHKPKEKKGGSTNREKKKLKPLMMVRAKKNKIRSNEKQLKVKIKSLKCQLGKVRSGKEAKRIKNKKIVKTPKKK